MLTMIQITIYMKVSDVAVVAILIVMSYERRQTVAEQPLDQLDIVTHLWENATQTEGTLQVKIAVIITYQAGRLERFCGRVESRINSCTPYDAALGA